VGTRPKTMGTGPNSKFEFELKNKKSLKNPKNTSRCV
jgi:hypothetical protein